MVSSAVGRSVFAGRDGVSRRTAVAGLGMGSRFPASYAPRRSLPSMTLEAPTTFSELIGARGAPEEVEICALLDMFRPFGRATARCWPSTWSVPAPAWEIWASRRKPTRQPSFLKPCVNHGSRCVRSGPSRSRGPPADPQHTIYIFDHHFGQCAAYSLLSASRHKTR